MDEVRFRPEQRDIIDGYKGGKVGIAAVPGSGKTFTLSHLAARLVVELVNAGAASGMDHQEVLVVTFTNTAVNSFRSRIAQILEQERGLLPYIGYRVRTLHGLAHDIVKERPTLVGLAEDFEIIDERAAFAIISDVARGLLKEYMDVFGQYLDPSASSTANQLRKLERQRLPGMAVDLAQQFIKHAKNHQLDPAAIRAALEQTSESLPLVRFGLAVYQDYQRSLSYRGAVDFDDLVRLAILALHSDRAYLRRLRYKWPYILEDEAQDSSKLQEEMLHLLSGDKNWVRVGDPNQAINTTFTTADPQFLRRFLQDRGVKQKPLHRSGRSVLPVLDLANTLVQWATRHHPTLALRDALDGANLIEPTGPDDPQPNPPADDAMLHIHYRAGENVNPDLELELVVVNIERFLGEHDGYTVAALVPENNRGYKLAEKLRERGVEYEELLRSTTATRKAARALYVILDYLSDPLDMKALLALYRDVWRESRFCSLQVDDPRQDLLLRTLSGCRYLERYLWPQPGGDWLEEVDVLHDQPELVAELRRFREQVRTWLEAVLLPVDQLVLTIVQDLFLESPDVALGHKIAAVMRSLARSSPDWRLSEFVGELRLISENERKFVGFDDAEEGYVPQVNRVTVATMHAAKGLEWDRVYLLGVNNYSFPSAQSYDEYIGESWFVRDSLNLQSETLAQLQALLEGTAYVEGAASLQARLDYSAERLRLLYVGITRAKRHLMLSWNMGRFWQQGGTAVKQPSLPLVALADYVDGSLQV